MDWLKLHAVINEVPAAGIGIGCVLLLIASVAGGGAIRTMAFKIFTVGSFFAVVAFLTGPPALVRLTTSPGLSLARIEAHHDAARLAVWMSGLLGLMSLKAILTMKH